MRFECVAENKMAVRRQLELLFREPQAGGAITVERTGPREEHCLRERPHRSLEGAPGQVTNDVVMENNLIVCVEGDLTGSYFLKTKTTVEAAKMICPQISLKEQIQKLKESLVVVHMRIELLIEKLEGLNQQKALAEKQGSYGRRQGQTPGCKRKKSNN
ncbi:hypothetical protein JD844_021271 [Phrynosoma platyrhinos]|uniref:Uncharacterized protein n=1 Tax=Phrynosoma platyrhinos TaxID=52577 RepID=A0ABQ7STD6_PHRPL|nr:hypothetical protein JD844_021271 [Phrynosoma platyrhinos]